MRLVQQWPAFVCSLVAVVLRVKTKAALAVSLAACALFVQAASPSPPDVAASDKGLWPWASQSPKPPPPVPPFEVPTFGQKRNFKATAAAWVKAPRIDGDAVFRAVLACYPTKSLFAIDVHLQAAVRSASVLDVTNSAIGRSYVGVVASMPLYSATEIDKEREKERQRRGDTAATVAHFIGALATRNQAVRSLALAAMMESRAQIRVNEGIADATEQIGYLDKIAAQEQNLIDAESKAMQARLQLVAMCRDTEADKLNDYLTELAQLPAEARP